MNPEEVYELFAAALRGISAESREGTEEVIRIRHEIALLVDLLVARGALTEGHRKLLTRATGGVDVRPRVRLGLYVDKYEVASSDVDCAARFPLCLGRCCSFRFELSKQDIEEGGVRWDLEQPYLIKQEADRFCTHFDRVGVGGCTIYEHRPAPCRVYDCREDRRVWLDFEKRIPAPLEEGVQPPKRA